MQKLEGKKEVKMLNVGNPEVNNPERLEVKFNKNKPFFLPIFIYFIKNFCS